MDDCKIHLTWDARHAATRAMLAGEPVVTPMELFIFMGGDPDQFTPEIEEHCIRDLKAHGYRLEKVAIEFYAPELQERWVRHEHWPEDDQWPE